MSGENEEGGPAGVTDSRPLLVWSPDEIADVVVIENQFYTTCTEVRDDYGVTLETQLSTLGSLLPTSGTFHVFPMVCHILTCSVGGGCTVDPKSPQDGEPMTDGGHDQWWCKACGHATDETPWDVEDCPECGACSWANRRYMVDGAAGPPATPDGGRIESPTVIFDDEADAQVAQAMRDQLGDARFVYIKTGDIAEATDYSNREVGQRLRRVASTLGLELAEWGQGHSSTTWHLSRGDGA